MNIPSLTILFTLFFADPLAGGTEYANWAAVPQARCSASR